MRRGRGVTTPYAAFRHPCTGELVVHPETQDAELLCLRARYEAGERGGIMEPARLARVFELAGQGRQNRQRIATRMLGASIGEIEMAVRLDGGTE
jgi:hypothetical protein